MLDYYRRVKANLQLLEAPLTVTYACPAGPQFVRALLHGLFPERTVQLRSATALNTSVGDVAVLVASTSNSRSVGEDCANARHAGQRDGGPPPFIIMLAPGSEPCTDNGGSKHWFISLPFWRFQNGSQVRPCPKAREVVRQARSGF